jgi:MerR family regulatory protein
MDDDELMTIGRFARLTGLSIGTLRHYDEVGLLTPAAVDHASGYRRYRRRQMHVMAGPDRMDLPGPSTFGLLVEDLDARHARALTAGAAEAVAPHDAEGMPRCSAVRDPSGNWIWLYQA